jgi:hypothetical protein
LFENIKLIQVMSEVRPSSKMDKVSGVVGVMGMFNLRLPLAAFADGSWEDDWE